MPKVEKIEDPRPQVGGVLPLWLTRRRGSPSKSPSIRVRCGCCKEHLIIFHDGRVEDTHAETLEINGVMGTICQWRQVLGPLLGFKEELTEQGKKVWVSTIKD